MAVNKYGNDFRNNIMWNKEYPFIPEITNDAGLTIHEGDILEFYEDCYKRFVAVRVYKIYDENMIWVRFINIERGISSTDLKANKLLPHIHPECKPPKDETDDFDNQGFSNELEWFLGSCYFYKYSKELSRSEDDWHADYDKFDAKRLEEVAKIKSQLKNKY